MPIDVSYSTFITETCDCSSDARLLLSRCSDVSLADAEQAHRDLNGRKTTGKLLLLPLEGPICAQVREHQRLSFTVSEM